MAKKTAWLLASLLVLPMAGCVGYMAYLDRPMPPSIAQLPKATTWSEQDRIFDAAIERRFPVGSYVGPLVDALRAEGYTVMTASAYGVAELTRSNVACGKYWSIGWKSDGNGRIAEIDGETSETCL